MKKKKKALNGYQRCADISNEILISALMLKSIEFIYVGRTVNNSILIIIAISFLIRTK